jgi:hypothetical protein
MRGEKEFHMMGGKKFACRIYNSGPERMLAVCDKFVLGKKFSEGEMSIHVSEEFYCGMECGEKEVVELAKSSTIINAVGKETINLMLANSLVREEYILWISGVPHAQVVSV